MQVLAASCDELRAMTGKPPLPSGEAATHLICGSNKPDPTTTFLLGLLDAGVEYLRLVNFGMKMKLNTFPDLPRDLLDCNATTNGYPPNKWDISIFFFAERMFEQNCSVFNSTIQQVPFSR
jgi:hypothetical protein